MGNVQSEVTDSVKKQADADMTKIKQYTLVDLAKRGTLVTIMRKAMRERNFDGVDDQIRELVAPFLYNDGAGKMIPISKIVRFRNKDRPPSKRLPPAKEDLTDGDSVTGDEKTTLRDRLQAFLSFAGASNKSKVSSGDTGQPDTSGAGAASEPCREVCWKLTERGAVGETALHTCLLVATVVHLELARRLVRIFPKMVNDIYLGDEYFGEGPLHIAVVNEDPKMVKFLLDFGADVHERSNGSFFCADDQKSERFDSIDHEYYNIPMETNYAGHVYWGEYPLAFAACLELEDCYRILLAKKANPDVQDTNGNTVLHMCVIWNRMSMFNLAYELGADVSIRNRQKLTPMALAAKLTRTEVFFYLTKLQRDVYWQFCNIATSAYRLEFYDSIDVVTGEVNQTSALSVVAFGEELGHLDMMDGVLVELLKSKWESFARERFFLQIKLFFVYFVITFFAFSIRPAPQVPPAGGAKVSVAECPANGHSRLGTTPVPSMTTPPFICWGEFCNETSTISSKNSSLLELQIVTNITMNVTVAAKPEVDQCYLLKFDTLPNQIRRLFDFAMVAGASSYIFTAYREGNRLGWKMFLETWSKVPGRVMFMASCILIVSSVPFRLTCQPRTDDHIIVAAMFLTPMHFLYFCRGFKSVGPFVIMIYKMIVSDLLCFVLIYMIFVFGFAEAFFVIFRSHRGIGTNLYFSGVVDSIMTMFLMSLGEFGDVYAEFENTDHPQLAKLLFIVYMILVSVLLVNMLIAMMGHTYEDIASRPNEWLRQWARIVLIVERGLTKEMRLEYQKKYSEMRNGRRVFLVKWETTDEEKEEIETLKELSAENEANQAKRRSDNGKKSSKDNKTS